jgi:hypothetical protein
MIHSISQAANHVNIEMTDDDIKCDLDGWMRAWI